MYDNIAQLIVKKKPLVQKYLRARGIKTSPRDTFKDVSDKLYGLILSSEDEAKRFDDFMTQNKSGFAQFIPMLFSALASDKGSGTSNPQEIQSNANLSLMNALTKKESQNTTYMVIGGAVFVIGIIAVVLIITSKKK